MDSHHVAIISELLLTRGSVNVLEYGSGGSTVYWPILLRDRGRTFRWDAVEHDPEYVSRVSDGLRAAAASKTGSAVHLWSVGLDEGYVNVVDVLPDPPDICIVDGRKRVRCCQAARRRGTRCVILHDAQREYYARAEAGFKIVDKHPGVTGDLWVMWT